MSLKNAPLVLTSNLVKNPWIWQKQTSIESPATNIAPVVELPRSIFWIPPKNDPDVPSTKSEIQEPILEINKHEKQAVKLIVIRRHKMRKHKLKKLRKKMKFEWAKVFRLFCFIYRILQLLMIIAKTTS